MAHNIIFMLLAGNNIWHGGGMRYTEFPLVLRLVHWLFISVLLYLVHQRGD